MIGLLVHMYSNTGLTVKFPLRCTVRFGFVAPTWAISAHCCLYVTTSNAGGESLVWRKVSWLLYASVKWSNCLCRLYGEQHTELPNGIKSKLGGCSKINDTLQRTVKCCCVCSQASDNESLTEAPVHKFSWILLPRKFHCREEIY